MDALELLKSDHQEVSALFKDALSGDTPKRDVVTKICDALTLHMAMEEKIFYPALRKAGGKDEKDSVLEAAEEHGGAKGLITKIRAVRGRDETLKAKVTVLKEMIEHHVSEEESEMFKEARKALGEERLQTLGVEMARFKARGGRGGARKASARKAPARKKAASRKTATRKTATRKKTRR